MKYIFIFLDNFIDILAQFAIRQIFNCLGINCSDSLHYILLITSLKDNYRCDPLFNNQKFDGVDPSSQFHLQGGRTNYWIFWKVYDTFRVFEFFFFSLVSWQKRWYRKTLH